MTECGEVEPKPKEQRQRKGLVMIFTGDGKGKTTAAMGMGLRAVGHGMRVLMLQFIKGNWRYGELAAIKRLAPEFDLMRHGAGFTWSSNGEAGLDRHHEAASEAMMLAREAVVGGKYDLIILDEACTAISLGLVTVEGLLALLQLKPPSLHIVLTGRGAPAPLVDYADLVTEMSDVKHHYRQGTKAQKGIEF